MWNPLSGLLWRSHLRAPVSSFRIQTVLSADVIDAPASDVGNCNKRSQDERP